MRGDYAPADLAGSHSPLVEQPGPLETLEGHPRLSLACGRASGLPARVDVT